MNKTSFILFAAIFGATISPIAAQSSVPLEVDTMIKRSLPFIEKEGIAWIEQKKCVSCHQVPSMLWSLQKAADAGFEVDREKLEKWSAWSREWKNWMNPTWKGDETAAIVGNTDTIAQLLLARSLKNQETWPQKFHDQLLQTQAENGAWQACGQLPLGKRPARETQEVSTMWDMLALKTMDKTPAANYERALKWLSESAPGKSTEWWVLQTLIQRDFGDKKIANERLEFLVTQQNADGGWGWLLNEDSDAFGTGLSLYGLSRAGLPATDSSLQKATAFLQKTQRPDGSWPVPSTRARDKNQIKPTSVYWGTAWAIIGLLENKNPPL